MKKINQIEMANIEGGLNCWVVGFGLGFAVVASLTTANPMIGIAIVGTLVSPAKKCWDS